MQTFSANTYRSSLGLAVIGLSLAWAAPAGSTQMQAPSVTAVSGKPALLMGNFDLAPLGYQLDEFFFSGTATSYQLPAAATPDGAWNATAAGSAPFKTRIVVARPVDPAKFNGTVLVEWLNVTAGQDAPADWMIMHREMIRSGYAYVAVSAQIVGVEGGATAMGLPANPLKKANAERYGTLSHPGDAYSFDIYSQAGALVRNSKANGVLGPLKPKRVIAIGESQSAAFLTTYVNAVDRLAKVYDGFLVHSRFGSSAPIEGTGMGGPQAKVPANVRFRSDLRVPVLTVITETDLLGAGLSGYHASRRPDDARLRVWEVAGTAHADNYLFAGAALDSGSANIAALAAVFVPSLNGPMGKLNKPVNTGMPHHYVTEAALAAVDRWVRTHRPPASTQPLQLATGGVPDVTPSLALDANGIALGGVRTPWVDVPTIQLSGAGDMSSFIGMLAGSGEPLSSATLAKLYPGGKADYLSKFTQALDAAIRAGHILAADRQEILDIASLNFAGQSIH